MAVPIRPHRLAARRASLRSAGCAGRDRTVEAWGDHRASLRLERIRSPDGGRSRRGSSPRSGAIRGTTLPAVGTAFQPEVVNPWVSGVVWGSSSMMHSRYRGASAGRIAMKVVRTLVLE